MADRPTNADIERALVALGASLEYPPTPSIAPAVIASLRTELRLRRRPPFPGLALWPRRRVLLLAAALVLLLAGTALAARLVIGAVEIRVVPTPATPRPTYVATGPALGDRVTLAEAQRAVSFPVRLPPGLGPPTEVHLAEVPFGAPVVVLTWEPDAAHPRIEGIPWGTMLMELPAEEEPVAFKELLGSTLFRTVRVSGNDGYWISGPHDLVLRTPQGERRFLVQGNVLLWQEGDTTFRLETALSEADAIALAETVR